MEVLIDLPPKLRVALPMHWSISKVKVFLTTVSPKLQYDYFQITTSTYLPLLQHKTIGQIVEAGGGNGRGVLELKVQRT